MFKHCKAFLSGVIITLGTIILCNTVFAVATGTNISVYYNNIKILINGNEIKTKDVNGKTEEPFIFNGTTYVPIRVVSEALNKIVQWDGDRKQILIYDIEHFWDEFVSVQNNYTGHSIYWRYIDNKKMDEVDTLIQKYGVNVLFEGLKSKNMYSQYYCINRLIEYYNDDEIKNRAINEITPFLLSTNETIKNGAEFAISVLNNKNDNKYITSCANGTKIFTLFNDYSDYGSFNELWMIKNNKLLKLYSFTKPSMYINSILLSPNKDKIAVQTQSNKSQYINIIDLNSKTSSPEIMDILISKVAKDKNYVVSYRADKETYSSNNDLKWIDNNTVEFNASLSYNNTEIIENVLVKYNVLNNALEYK
jgi:hypothetical protein